MEKFNISDWEQRIINNNENNKNYFDQNMVYKAKIIGNAHEANSIHCSANNDFFEKECIYMLSDLIIKIIESRMVNHLGNDIRTCDVTISEKKNPNKPVYISYVEYIPGDWIKKFEELFNESFNLNTEEKQKVYTKNKELLNK